MEISRHTVPAADGYPLAATLYEADSATPERAATAVSIHPATGVKRSFYDPFARYLAEHGLTTLTFDYRGIGESRPASLRGFDATMRDWGEHDITGAVAWLRRERRPRRLLAVGHSVGGQLMGITPAGTDFDGLLAVAAQSGYWGLWPAAQRPRILALWYLFIPLVSRLMGYFPAHRFGLGEPLPAGVAREWARWGRRRHYISEPDGSPARRGFAAFRAPLRALSFTDDPIAPRPAVEELLSWFVNAPVDHQHLSPAELGVESIGHFGCFRPRFEETLWRPSRDWLLRGP